MKRNNRFLAHYLHLKFKKSVKGASENELEGFLDANGWILYDLETMTNDFLKWRNKDMAPKHKIMTLS
jgi:hypothetical protein